MGKAEQSRSLPGIQLRHPLGNRQKQPSKLPAQGTSLPHPLRRPRVRTPSFGFGRSGLFGLFLVLHPKAISFLRFSLIEPLQCSGDSSQAQFSLPSMLLPRPSFQALAPFHRILPQTHTLVAEIEPNPVLLTFILSTLNTSVDIPLWQALANPISSEKRVVESGVEVDFRGSPRGRSLVQTCQAARKGQSPRPSSTSFPTLITCVTSGIFPTRCFAFLILPTTLSGRSGPPFFS